MEILSNYLIKLSVRSHCHDFFKLSNFTERDPRKYTYYGYILYIPGLCAESRDIVSQLTLSDSPKVYLFIIFCSSRMHSTHQHCSLAVLFQVNFQLQKVKKKWGNGWYSTCGPPWLSGCTEQGCKFDENHRIDSRNDSRSKGCNQVWFS